MEAQFQPTKFKILQSDSVSEISMNTLIQSM